VYEAEERPRFLCRKESAHEGASRGEIAYTTDNERELAWRRKKEKGERLLSDEEGEQKN
jgi:hypothetical protein